MHQVGSSWLMTSMTSSPLVVALVQTATTLPIFLFALPAGALADIVDRRRLLLLVQCGLFFSVVTLVICLHFNWMSPAVLIAFTFLMGTGAAFISPTWQAIVPDLVDKSRLSPAVALNSVGINISRAIGPALAGLIIVKLNVNAVFMVNALSFLVVIAALVWWQGSAEIKSTLPRETLFGAVKSGLHYTMHSTALRATLWRAFAFFISTCAFWALLPLIVRQKLNGSVSDFGLMLAAIGVGAVLGSFVLPTIKRRLSAGGLVSLASLINACVLIFTGLSQSIVATMLLCAVYGSSWIWILSSLNVSTQLALPKWGRARGLSVYLVVFFGSMSAGSLFWGSIASIATIDIALYVAATTLVLGVILSHGLRLNQGETMSLGPANYWPSPMIHQSSREDSINERSPVLITVEYRIAPEQRKVFLSTMKELEHARKRHGAFHWSCLQDSANPERFLESFKEISWLSHLRHHERVSGEDEKLQAKIAALTKAGKTEVNHFLGSETH
ncbi:MAG: MFS family permease [Cellvibrionaceae bacterium]|jgi:MFS family permease